MADQPPKPIGRPSLFTQELADTICEKLSDGSSLRTICAADGMPARSSVFKWLNENTAFSDQYARAREAQADALFDEIIDIADDSAGDWEQRKHFAGDDESLQVNGDAIARAKLKVDSRKWVAGKLRPKKYGEKLGLDQTIAVAPELSALMDRIAGQGQRLTPVDEPDE